VARAMQKMLIAATKYDKNHPSAMGLDGFETKELVAGEFQG